MLDVIVLLLRLECLLESRGVAAQQQLTREDQQADMKFPFELEILPDVARN